MCIAFKIVEHASTEYEDTVRLRDQVLRKPLNLSFSQEELAQENSSFHLAGYWQQEIVACLILKPSGRNTVKMRQVAVCDKMQGKGIGKLLVLFAEDFARQSGYREIILHARETAIPFYLKLGYETSGTSFSEVGLPHKMMLKQLD